MTAFVIPNAIQITTRQAKYTFASFLARDTTFDVIFNIWKLVRPEQALGGPVLTNTSNSVATSASASMSGSGLVTSPRGSLEGIAVVGGAGGKKVESRQPKVTQCRCGMEGKHFSELAIEMVFPGTPDRIHNLMFASGFMKDFMVVDQKLTDIQMSDWAPVTPGSTLLARNMSYIKPLNASLGPKQAKCEIRDETEYCDWEDYVSTVTTTRTPEVPSGGVFAVKTRCCIMWASRISTRVVVTTQVDWTGRSFIKGIIERSAIDGQKTYHGELERSMRAYIQEHIAEFVPEGVDPSALQETTTTAVPSTPAPGSNAQPSSSTASRSDPDAQRKQKEKQREHERNQRSLQWAWDTFDGAFGVAKQSAKGAIELIRDAWDQSSSTTILYFVIVFLVLSNVWTLVRVGSGGVVGGVGGLVGGGRGKDDEPVLVGGVGGGKGKVRGALGLNEEVERERKEWVHSVVTALWEELNHGGLKSLDPLASSTLSLSSASPVSSPSTPLMTGTPGDLEEWWKEVKELEKALETIEDRMKVLKESIGSVKVQQQHHDGHALVDEL
ncbi:hypothetical protein BDN72DRAFT_870757 [Pluteus cervinus]|uniref:Uncharacterized protein n=1 Tax=Pluteus cervinus TaxID=181527 RepID=A0ACD3ATL1_9AGAR|nr:hypothetical protein BDN72DRAFT_870757 [Pluteus cervinus]